MTLVGGVDGCPAGWLLAECRVGESNVRTRVFADVATLLDATHDFAKLAIDIPIGLPDRGTRDADRAARAYIGPRRSSVFPAPLRVTLDATDYADASDRSFAAHGKRLSRQAYAIVPRIREVDLALRADPALLLRVHEVHPEVSFCAMNGGTPLADSKHARAGLAAREALLEPRFPGAFPAARARHARGAASDDDILDALAVLWSAERLARGEAFVLPRHDCPRDGAGIPMRIWG